MAAAMLLARNCFMYTVIPVVTPALILGIRLSAQGFMVLRREHVRSTFAA